MTANNTFASYVSIGYKRRAMQELKLVDHYIAPFAFYRISTKELKLKKKE